MAKSKDHMAHNQSYKAHKNNIKKPMRGCQTSTKGEQEQEGFRAKLKNYLAHNQSYKAQKNDIKKPSATARPPPRGVLNKAHDDARSRAQNSGI
uniref:60S ribosomal protein L29 n=1 Tax=Zea mays TaxID=4577 RepID=A0A804MIA0_MAIZE